MPAALLLMLAAQQPALAPAGLDGRWTNPAKSVIIALAPCGDARCGTVEWASDKARADARKGTPELIGAELLRDLKPRTAGIWRGKLFVPDQKLRVSAKLELLSDNELKVTGCAAARALCKSQLWTRVK